MREDYKTSVAVYLRKSRSDPDDESMEDTLSRHTDSIMQMSRKAELNIVKIYREIVSGSTLFARPEMLNLLQDIEAGKYTAVACMDIDRLGRSSQKDTGIILETFKDNNIVIITPAKIYDLNDDYDEQSVEMQSFLARQEYKSITRRLRRGTMKSCEYGYHVSDVPFGYERVYVDKHPTLKPIPEQAEAVKMIFDMYVNQHFGSYTIANKLNAMRIKPRKGDVFSRTTVQFILHNPVYTGKIVWNKYKHIRKKTVYDKHKTVQNPQSEWIVAKGIHTAIIPCELFDEAQEIIKKRSHPPAFTGELKNVFAGLVYCSNCGTAIQRQHNSKQGIQPRLICPNKGCTSGVPLSAVEDYVINILKNVLSDCTSDIKRRADNKANSQKNAYQVSVRQAERSIKAIESQRNKLYDLLEQGIYDTDTFMQRNDILEKKRSDAENELEKYTALLSDMQDKSDTENMIPVMSRLWGGYNTLSPAEKNQFYKTLIARISYKRSHEQRNHTFDLDIEFLSNI